ncbi:MAG TPA: flagellar motor protein MotA, partial [Cellvibrionales bacterium]|nr:flagellar motor protein MotA [Cellvibrionales bacterium]
AMNTTAFGLISAIPLLLFHALLQTKTSQIIDSLDVICVKCLNAYSSRNDINSKARKDDIKAAA